MVINGSLVKVFVAHNHVSGAACALFLIAVYRGAACPNNNLEEIKEQ